MQIKLFLAVDLAESLEPPLGTRLAAWERGCLVEVAGTERFFGLELDVSRSTYRVCDDDWWVRGAYVDR